MNGSPKAVVVTGGAQGIGFAIARAFAAEGRRVALFGTREVAAGQQALTPSQFWVRRICCAHSPQGQVALLTANCRQ